jgi:hypothetical protein
MKLDLALYNGKKGAMVPRQLADISVLSAVSINARSEAG